MTNSNLRPEAGGDPARSNSTDLKNDPDVMQHGNDFPDAPTPEADPVPQDQPDLDAFAAKIGTDTIESGDGLDAVRHDVTDGDVSDSRSIFVGAAIIAGLIGLLVWRRRRKSAMTRIVETINVFD